MIKILLMTKPFIFFILIFFEGLLLKGQVIVSPGHNPSAKKIDKKIDIISNIPDSALLGYLPSENVNDRKFIKPSDEINKWLQNFVDGQFESSSDTKSKKILWVIQDLSLGKDSTEKDVFSFVKLKADIYDNTAQNTTNYQLINTFDTTWIIRSAKADFGQMIAVAFNDLYKQSIELKKSISNKRLEQLTEKFTGTKEEIIKKVKLSNTHPILKDSIYPSGVYVSFNDFKNNSPSIKNFYTNVDSQSNMINLYQLLPDSSSQLVKKAWGISVNNELYFYASGQLYPIEKSGNTFYAAKYLEPKTRRNQALYWRQYVGKWQGDNNPYNNVHVLRKSTPAAANVSLEATHLDFDLEDFTY